MASSVWPRVTSLVPGGEQPAIFPLLPGVEPEKRQGCSKGHRPDRRHNWPIHGDMVAG
jgi:hypothetical protein